MIKFERRFLESPYFIEKYEFLLGEKYRFDTNSELINCWENTKREG